VKSLAEGIAQDLGPNAHFLVELRIYHPVIAILVAFYSLYIVRTLYLINLSMAKRMLLALLIVGIVQILLGLTNLLLLAPLPMQLLHLLMAESVWIIYILTAAVILARKTPEHEINAEVE
jgi:heme A synthase